MMFDYKTYDKPFYHGSKGGIIGEISPVSPNKNRIYNPSDFGDGFYIGTNIEQAKGVCIENDNPFLYTLKVDFSKISDNKIITLNDKQWLYTVLSCRKKSEDFYLSPFAEEIRQIINNYDIIIGTIADDRMNEAIVAFSNGDLSDKGLLECLKYIDYGTQIVIKTTQASKMIDILSEKSIYGLEKQNTIDEMKNLRKKSKDVVKNAKTKYRREGLFVDEILEQINNGEIKTKDIFPLYYIDPKSQIRCTKNGASFNTM